ncbi:MAG: type VI secretion system ImpA family N-terminal domain-containing protein, partial [Desulfamplus sp.]|nr:type VI secretion system ImpA family N-terminal domain-containing protein [Desulfamplus sp.]
MGKINKEILLQPVSEDMPCGEDLSDLTEYYVLEELAKGKEETQFSEAESPEWSKVFSMAVQLLEQGKELWVFVHLLTSIVSLDGAKGLSEGLDLLYEALKRFWDDIYPKLDEDEDNPAEQRMNILNNLTTVGSMFFEGIKDIPLCNSKQLGVFSWRHVLLANGGIPPAKNQEVPKMALIEAAIKESDPELISDIHMALSRSVKSIHDIDQFLTQQVGSFNNTSKITLLADLLDNMIDTIQSVINIKRADDDVPDETFETSEDVLFATTFQQSINQDIASQKDVILMLHQVSLWYA